METAIDPQVRWDLANETVRRYGEMSADFSHKMAKRIKRKFHTNLDVATILSLATHFKQIYEFGSSILSGYISPSENKYANLTDIKIDDFISAFRVQYPKEDKAIVKTISDWVIYYEYLR